MPLDAATQKVLKATKFPPEFDKRVDTQKVNLDVIKTWIAGKINEFLPEDDIVVDMVYNILETDQFVSTPPRRAVLELTRCNAA
jgi:c-di-GMP-related signal transduction protein